MNLQEAKDLLNTAMRDELRDHAFGDCEVYWRKGDEDIAAGYFGGDDESVQIGETIFRGPEARELRECGARGGIGRNDSTGPAEYTEGACLPDLTREGVLEELTKRPG